MRNLKMIAAVFFLLASFQTPARAEDEFKSKSAGFVSSKIEKFSSAGEFDAYARALEDDYKRKYPARSGYKKSKVLAQPAMAPASAAAEKSSPQAGAASITNVQEAGVDEGDMRSHGFFYHPVSDAEGIAGLPVRKAGRTFMHIAEGSAGVIFLKVSSGLSLSRIGDAFIQRGGQGR